jgi:hypothetical protein
MALSPIQKEMQSEDRRAQSALSQFGLAPMHGLRRDSEDQAAALLEDLYFRAEPLQAAASRLLSKGRGTSRQTQEDALMSDYDCHTCGNSGDVNHSECPDCIQCPECDGKGDTGNWYGDPQVPGGTRSLPCDRCRGSGRLPQTNTRGVET